MPDHVFAPGGQHLTLNVTSSSKDLYFMTPNWSVANETTGVFEVQSIRVMNNSNKRVEVYLQFMTGLQPSTNIETATQGGNSMGDMSSGQNYSFMYQIEAGHMVDVSDKSTPFYFKAYDYNEAPAYFPNTGIKLLQFNQEGGTHSGYITMIVYYKYYLNRQNSTSTESQGLFRYNS